MCQSLQGNQDKLKENLQILSIFMNKLHTELMERGLLKRLWSKHWLCYIYTPSFLSAINNLSRKLVKAVHITHTVCMYVWLCWVFVSVRGLSLVVASGVHSSWRRGGHSSSRCVGLSLSRPLVAEHRFHTRRLSNWGSRAELFRGMWDLPRLGLEPVSPALAGRFSTTAPPGKSPQY